MRSQFHDHMPGALQRGLQQWGADLSTARRKRGLTAQMVAERAGLSRATYQRIERGDPTVAMGGYAMVVFVLGLGQPWDQLAAPGRDEAGLLSDEARLPKRVRPRKEPVAW